MIKRIYLRMVLIKWKTNPYIQGNGRTSKEMEEGSKFGRTDLYMKAIGRIIWRVSMAALSTPMGTFMKENG